jgi:heme-degrading monooxygenase HmoA
MSQTLELVTFRLARGDAEAFAAANAELNDWLKQQPGFISRHLAERDDGSFVDAVLWSNNESAHAAGERILAEMGESEAMQMIDPRSVTMSHSAVRLSAA